MLRSLRFPQQNSTKIFDGSSLPFRSVALRLSPRASRAFRCCACACRADDDVDPSPRASPPCARPPRRHRRTNQRWRRMAAGGGRHDDEADEAPGAGAGADADLYAVLGLSKECSDADLKVAYRKLAKTWHPDKCTAPGSSARVEEAKERFQEIQGAYSVLSDTNKRLLYDVGVYDGDDDAGDLSGMGDFLGEMAQMMSQATPTESFEDLQQLFVDMFQDDLDAGCFGGPDMGFWAQAQAQSPACTSSSSPPPARTHAQAPPLCKGVNMWCSPATDSGKPMSPGRAGSIPGLDISGLFFKGGDSRQSRAPRTPSGSIGGRRRKQMSPARHGVSSDGEASHAHQSQRQRRAF